MQHRMRALVMCPSFSTLPLTTRLSAPSSMTTFPGLLPSACTSRSSLTTLFRRTPFTNESGASVLTHFSFTQDQTDYRSCLESLMAILMQSRLRLSGAAKRAVQIAFVISDGRIASKREVIAKLLRDAEENNILVVLLIIDNPSGGEELE